LAKDRGGHLVNQPQVMCLVIFHWMIFGDFSPGDFSLDDFSLVPGDFSLDLVLFGLA